MNVCICISVVSNLEFSRVKQLKEEPYTQKEAEAVVGLRTDSKGPNKSGPEKAFDREMEMET